MSLSKKVIESVSWLAVGQAGQRVASLVVATVLARILAPADFGLVAMALISVNLIAVCRELGITANLVQRRDVSPADLDTGFWLNLGAGTLLYLLGAAMAVPISLGMGDRRIVPLLLALLVSIPIYTLAQVSDALLQRRLAFRELALIEAGSTAFSGLLGIGLALSGAGLWALVAQNVGFAVVMSGARLVAAKWRPRVRFDRASARGMFGFSGSVLGCSLTAYAMRNVDNLIVGWVLGSTALGYYGLGYNLMLMPAYAVTTVVGRVMFPALASVRDDLPRARIGYLRSLRVLSSVSLPLVVGLAATAPAVVQVIYGTKWAPTAQLVQILVGVGVLEALNVWGVIFFAMGKPHLMLGWFAGSTLLMAVVLTIGVHWGLPGVAWAYAFVAPITLGGPHLIVNRILGLRTRDLLRAVSPALVSSAVMGLAVVAADRSGAILTSVAWVRLLALVPLGAMVYLAAMGIIASLSGGGADIASWVTGKHLLRVERASYGT